MTDSEIDVAAFARRITAFLDRLEALATDQGEDSFAAELTAHLGFDPLTADPVSRTFPQWRHADLDQAVEQVLGPTASTLGISDGDPEYTLTDLVVNRGGIYRPSAVARQSVQVGPRQQRRVVSEAVHLFTWEQRPVVLLQHSAGDYGVPELRVEVLCADPDSAQRLLDEVAERMDAQSVLRGQVMTLGAPLFEPVGASMMTFHERPEVPESSVILPHGLLGQLHRHVVGLSALAEPLRQAGQHLRRGVLLYGAPGTGKTHTVRHLIGAAPEATVLLLTGEALASISLAAQTARALQPAIVVLEDCDLVAEDRELSADGRPLLFELLDCLDGQGGDADIVFVLTTNRISVLEPALTQRPGRIDLAVEIPRPDLAARTALFGLYAAGTGFSETARRTAAEQTEGITASFVREAVRRAVVTALAESRDPEDADLLSAVDQLSTDQEHLAAALSSAEDGFGGEFEADYDEEPHATEDENWT